ncbi:hypothetical protein FHS44_006097 [Streptosporangium saharense]|uniref:Uncharacterized protein n=1 Tax=Streptosporangium saharense TaxID=1706840 RepID=A0A7W7VQF7_9ACTN|nr:hypothetical protein [Streptosporangium saharense]
MTDIQRTTSRPERSREADTRTTSHSSESNGPGPAQATNRMTSHSSEFDAQEAEETPHG